MKSASPSSPGPPPFRTRRGVAAFFCTFLCGTAICYFPLFFGSMSDATAAAIHNGAPIHYFNEFVLAMAAFLSFNLGLASFFIFGEPLANCCSSDSSSSRRRRNQASFAPLHIDSDKDEEQSPPPQQPHTATTTEAEQAYNLWCRPYRDEWARKAENTLLLNNNNEKKSAATSMVVVQEGAFVYNGTQLSNLDFDVAEYFEDGDERV